ncbi:MAG: hypothetical protein U1E53_15975 [Dongiaceae bacterium]
MPRRSCPIRTGLLCAALALLLLAAPPARAAEPLRVVGDCRDQDWPDDAAMALCTAVLDQPALSRRERAAAYRIRGRSRLATGDTGGGAADLDRAIALDPDDPLAWLLRAGARQVAGDLPARTRTPAARCASAPTTRRRCWPAPAS